MSAGAALVGTAATLAKGSGQSGAVSAGQQQSDADLQPFTTTGVAANKQTADLLGLNGQPAADTAMSTFQASPGYQYQVDQGLRAVDAGAASKGLLHSGATIKAEETLGSNLANQDFGNYVSRLNGLSNYGITAAGGQASTDASAGTNQASIYGNTANGVGNSIGTALQNPNVQSGINSLFSTSPSQSASAQYANPYGGTGAGQLIVGANGLAGGGV